MIGFFLRLAAAFALAAPASAGLFGSVEHARTTRDAWGNWTAMMAREAATGCRPAEIAARPFGDVAPGGARGGKGGCGGGGLDTAAVVDAAARLAGVDRLRRVNEAVNVLPYREDASNYGATDYWATLPEFVARGGDCEDYAIAKYMLLKRAGVPADAMRIAVVRDLALGVSHAVLAVEEGGVSYILDNQSGEVLPDRDVARYQPVYSINERGWWLHMPA
jgi:predicted transglutaminase-like cysteine proteinase